MRTILRVRLTCGSLRNGSGRDTAEYVGGIILAFSDCASNWILKTSTFYQQNVNDIIYRQQIYANISIS